MPDDGNVFDDRDLDFGRGNGLFVHVGDGTVRFLLNANPYTRGQ
jgi:hypothetical protein